MRPLTVFIWGSRLLLAGLFLTAGLIKAGASEGFAITIATFSILPPTIVTAFANLLPWVEILAALLLLIPPTARLGAALAALLLFTFIGALAWALSQGLIVDCGCFGESPPSLSKMVVALVRNVILLALTLALAVRSTRVVSRRN
ncbi:MAG: MauE/DoxX family redox-associated membrane protein [Chthoniobacterales bacterium]